MILSKQINNLDLDVNMKVYLDKGEENLNLKRYNSKLMTNKSYLNKRKRI